jgi:acyl carrier protein
LAEAIVDIFTEVLGGGTVEPESDFFEIGGDSILAAKAVVRLRRRLVTTVTMRDIFTARSAKALAEVLVERVG